MLDGNQLTYASAERPWYAWELESRYLNSFLVAVLVTIISYQATALVFDVLLGFKKRGEARVNAFHSLLLAWKSSPLAVSSSVFRKDWITRSYYKGHIPKGTSIAREEKRVTATTTGRLLVLLAVAPIANVLSVIMTLERTKEVTFAEAGFEGAVFGVNKDLSTVAVANETFRCRSYPIKARRSDTMLFRYQTCVLDFAGVTASSLHLSEEFAETSCIRILAPRAGNLQMDVAVNTRVGRRTLNIEIVVGRRSLALNNTVTDESIKPLIERAMQFLVPACGYRDSNAVQELSYQDIGYPIFDLPVPGAYRLISCQVIANATLVLEKLMNTIEESFTLIPSEGLSFSTFADPPQPVSIASLTALKRRESNVSLPFLAITAGVLLLVRLALAAVLSNDLVDGIELVLKQRYGMSRCEPMLHAGEEVKFRKTYQSGGVAHYGLARSDMDEVDMLKGGIVGGEECGEKCI